MQQPTLQDVHTAAARLNPNSPHFNLCSDYPIYLPHCDFFKQSEGEILESLEFDFPQVQQFPSRYYITAIIKIHPVARLQRFPFLQLMRYQYFPEVNGFDASMGLQEVKFDQTTFEAFAKMLVCPYCRMSYNAKYLAQVFVEQPFQHFERLSECLAVAATSIMTLCKTAYLQHISCEKIRLLSVLETDEYSEARRRLLLNEMITRAFTHVAETTNYDAATGGRTQAIRSVADIFKLNQQIAKDDAVHSSMLSQDAVPIAKPMFNSPVAPHKPLDQYITATNAPYRLFTEQIFCASESSDVYQATAGH